MIATAGREQAELEPTGLERELQRARPLEVARWPSERPLGALVLLASLALWALLALSVVGALYAALLALALFAAQLALITHVRGSAVRLGPEQLPELWARVEELSQRIGLARPPEAYLMQAGGALNALATRFLRADLIVLYADLLDACGENEAARDFIVAHELGHLRAGHLRLAWLRLPGMLVPFLGSAYSRAREYSCDRYGAALCGDSDGALAGLCILAAGGRQGPRVNRRALAAQRRDLETAWMKLGQWLASHPPIARRAAALDGELAVAAGPGRGLAALGAAAVVALAALLPLGGAGLAVYAYRRLAPHAEGMERAQAGAPAQAEVGAGPGAADPVERVRAAMLALVEAAETHRASAGGPPPDAQALYATWSALHPGEAEPLDPWHGTRFGYRSDAEHYVIYSAGPDANDDSDNLWYSSRQAAEAARAESAPPAAADAPKAPAARESRPARKGKKR